jgi:hypothetical protein
MASLVPATFFRFVPFPIDFRLGLGVVEGVFLICYLAICDLFTMFCSLFFFLVQKPGAMGMLGLFFFYGEGDALQARASVGRIERLKKTTSEKFILKTDLEKECEEFA